MKLGVCAVPAQSTSLASAGFDFIELHVQRDLKTLENNQIFDSALREIRQSTLPCSVANCFVPGDLKITGEAVDEVALEKYVTLAITRAHYAGIDTIVFGSGGARRVPEGFDRDAAWEQLVTFGKMIGPIALQNGVTIAVEPLNQKECNILTTVGETGRYIEDIDHPAVRLLVDAYHWGLDNDSYDDIVKYGHMLCHVHIATFPSRRPPGLEVCDFSSFFSALNQVGYDGRISIEATWDNIVDEAFLAHSALLSMTLLRPPE